MYCYILQSAKSGGFYVGHAANLETRLRDHNAGKVVSTRNKGPWAIVYREKRPSRTAASQRECEIKSWKSADRIRFLIGLERPENREGR